MYLFHVLLLPLIFALKRTAGEVMCSFVAVYLILSQKTNVLYLMLFFWKSPQAGNHHNFNNVFTIFMSVLTQMQKQTLFK